MREARRIQAITEVRVDEVVERDRLRPVSEKGVQSLLASISELGVMMDPIHVRKVKHRNGELVLMAGGHRLEAARRLGWETIPAAAWDCSDDWARLMELDDNLAGSDLSFLDKAVFLAERKRLYEDLHPEARHGGDRKSDQVELGATRSFAASVAEAWGISERQVRSYIQAGLILSPTEVRQLRGAPHGVQLADLKALAGMTSEERGAVVRALHDGQAKRAAAARKAIAAQAEGAVPPPANGSPEHKALRLSDAWGRAPEAVRLDFVARHADELVRLQRAAEVARAQQDAERGGRPEPEA
jgi:ParB family chromosome partitioning protein